MLENPVVFPISKNSALNFMKEYQHLSQEEFEKQVSVNQIMDSVDYRDILGLIGNLEPNVQEDLYQEFMSDLSGELADITPDEFANISEARTPELISEVNTLFYAKQLDFDPTTDFKVDSKSLKKNFGIDCKDETLTFDIEDPWKELDKKIKESEEKKIYMTKEEAEEHDKIVNSSKSKKEKYEALIRNNAKKKFELQGVVPTEKQILEEMLKLATGGLEEVEAVMGPKLNEKEVALAKALQNESDDVVPLLREALPSLLQKVPGNHYVEETMIEYFKVERQMNKSFSKDHAIQDSHRQNTYVDSVSGEKMWKLHKENPDFYTGEKLAELFGVTRQRAWAELIMREHLETEDGKFNYDKVAQIFKEERKEKKEPKTLSKKFKTEDEAYKDYLKISKSSVLNLSQDEKLPDFAKKPFSSYKKEEQEPTIEKISTSELEKNRTKLLFADIGRDKNDQNREFRVRDKDGTLRSASWTEQSFLARKKSFPKTKKGLGGKSRRLQLKRRRIFKD
jgi:hypothetical protein